MTTVSEMPKALCTHKAKVRVASHRDLTAAFHRGEDPASIYCCLRDECQKAAKAWVKAMTRRDITHVIPLRSWPK